MTFFLIFGCTLLIGAVLKTDFVSFFSFCKVWGGGGGGGGVEI